MNDGVCDPAGRFWAGTSSTPRAPTDVLASLEPDGAARIRLTGVTVSNGICFTPDGRLMYYVDTLPHRRLESFAVAADGRLSARTTVATVRGGNPDGIAIDDEGCVWVAVWDAGEVRRYSPAGETLDVVRVPARRPTAVALAGQVLLITSASLADSADEGPSFYGDRSSGTDLGGLLFAAHVGAAGIPAAAWGPRLSPRAVPDASPSHSEFCEGDQSVE
jgi:sugar lactone lactonase YvrE